MPLSARELFARMIRCEAEGEGESGMKAVATVIMNRVHVPYGEYMRVCQGDLRKVLLQPYQFTCAMETVYGQYNPQNIYNIPARQVDYDIADWALSGNKHPGVGECLWYYNPFSESCSTYFPATGTGVLYNRIGQHCFYSPTPRYAET
ncbi:cell wall hydrolase SleB [Thermoclostridium stercorarium subsp. stercorarium DSM 8532]|jgi:N-acetylmuramoyl-L-alanine amidase|uniref:Cell wall hydrolase SleB n=3 Tax=Thermoclostridium stercorarium TaxID=1510 RepID=L7VQS4_THES1|nr:cell wall hydrolase [Thermoclostridium stercorarium]AGC67923.1 cell wall hydrolase SleB [Thermoclostridium stercorarium subsp. stercorarium DSM 8532]AGI38961.1 cell wall hydrolase [Thermoclostridium stercorarium subsp. stercorarium DSM 8532]ANW98330.1 cell wall hydrolase [Thermoclostridium stercorarium subsp. thermolacticum DSM 2910]ANX00857.1 cell wall hydrolase [Thermoclostridium stercorarium subsp. leptospartum DSM 9219]UZQ86469.1 cell wall hydrolase [Thermoclostridium stercorarium]